MPMLDLRQVLARVSEAQFNRIERLMSFVEAIEKKEFDPLMVKSNGYKAHELERGYKIASKALVDIWKATLAQQVSSISEDVPDDLEALYYELLSMSEKDVGRLQAAVKLFRSDVDIEQFLALAEKIEGGKDGKEP